MSAALLSTPHGVIIPGIDVLQHASSGVARQHQFQSALGLSAASSTAWLLSCHASSHINGRYLVK